MWLFIGYLACCLLICSDADCREFQFEGEPYKLWGNRLVFTNWQHVRQGGVGWMTRDGTRLDLDNDAEPGSLRFQPSNGTMHDFELMIKHCPSHVQVKAAGGVPDLDTLLTIRKMGLTRVGKRSVGILDDARVRLAAG